MALTPKQQRFIEEYLIDLNASAAYQRAGYQARGNAAEVNASRLLRNAQVQAAIRAAQAARARRTEINADRVAQELARLALSDLSRLASWGPEGVIPRPSAAISADDTSAVAEVSATRYGLKVKLHSKPQALRLLGEHLGVFKERPPLEVLLAALPAELATAVRQELARLLSGEPAAPGGGDSAAGAAPA